MFNETFFFIKHQHVDNLVDRQTTLHCVYLRFVIKFARQIRPDHHNLTYKLSCQLLSARKYDRKFETIDT